MPEHKGNVAAKSQYGIKFSDDGPWFNWTLPEKRGEPFDDVEKGDSVRVEYGSYEKKDRSKGYNIYVIENLSRSTSDEPFPVEEEFPTNATSEPLEGGVTREQSIIRQCCVKAAGMALQHNMGNAQEKAGQMTYLAGVLEDWVLR